MTIKYKGYEVTQVEYIQIRGQKAGFEKEGGIA